MDLVLRVLSVSTANMTGHDRDPDLLTYPPGHSWTVSTGWDSKNFQHLHANNWGFIANRDFLSNPLAVALVGDSYVESSMLDADARPGA